MYSQCTEYFIEVFCHWEQDIQSKNTLIKPATYFTHEWSCKETLSLQAFIVKRVFILNIIAFKTGHSLEVGLQCKERSHWSVLSLRTRHSKLKDINYIRNLLYTWTKLQKETLCSQAFIVKRVFILNIIAFKTGHFLEMVQLMQRRQSLKLTIVETGHSR